METENKQTRTSPRTLAFQEVIALIDAQMTDSELQPGTAALTYLRQQVEAKVGTKRQVVKASTKKPRAPKAPKVQGTHFVAKFADRVEYVSGKDIPTLLENDPIVVVFGPWATKAGALFAMEAATYYSKPTTYGKPV
jgi:hypothetical protein